MGSKGDGFAAAFCFVAFEVLCPKVPGVEGVLHTTLGGCLHSTSPPRPTKEPPRCSEGGMHTQ